MSESMRSLHISYRCRIPPTLLFIEQYDEIITRRQQALCSVMCVDRLQIVIADNNVSLFRAYLPELRNIGPQGWKGFFRCVAQCLGECGHVEFTSMIGADCVLPSLAGAVEYLHSDYVVRFAKHVSRNNDLELLISAIKHGSVGYLEFIYERLGGMLSGEIAEYMVAHKKWEHLCWVICKRRECLAPLPSCVLSVSEADRQLILEILPEKVAAWVKSHWSESATIFQLTLNDGKQDRMLRATYLFHQRLREIERARVDRVNNSEYGPD